MKQSNCRRRHLKKSQNVCIKCTNISTAIQGIGAGGVNVLIEIIVCDLLPLRDRGKYLGVMFGFIALGTALGPLFGGLIVQNVSWRWVFYLNLRS
jgi:MFS family permease